MNRHVRVAWRVRVPLVLAGALVVASAAAFVGTALAGTPVKPSVTVARSMGGPGEPSSGSVTVVGRVGEPGQLPASVNVRLNRQTGQLSGGWSYDDHGVHLTGTATCLKYRVLAPGVDDAVITETVAYPDQPSEHIVLEVVDNDSPGGIDAVRMSFQSNGGVVETTPSCWAPVYSPVPISVNTIEIKA